MSHNALSLVFIFFSFYSISLFQLLEHDFSTTVGNMYADDLTLTIPCCNCVERLQIGNAIHSKIGEWTTIHGLNGNAPK